jgi:hypothetical protein|tara:strand:- start:377 stop:1027 length:651 start_codon:yes stop_codon:yes gene_type:complete
MLTTENTETSGRPGLQNPSTTPAKTHIRPPGEDLLYAPVTVLHTNNVIEVGSGNFKNVTGSNRTHSVYRTGRDVKTLSGIHYVRDKFVTRLQLKFKLPRENVNRFIFDLMVLQAKLLTFVDMKNLAYIPIGVGEYQLITPWFFNTLHSISYQASSPGLFIDGTDSICSSYDSFGCIKQFSGQQSLRDNYCPDHYTSSTVAGFSVSRISSRCDSVTE